MQELIDKLIYNFETSKLLFLPHGPGNHAYWRNYEESNIECIELIDRFKEHGEFEVIEALFKLKERKMMDENLSHMAKSVHSLTVEKYIIKVQNYLAEKLDRLI
jgi:hypothetical protein